MYPRANRIRAIAGILAMLALVVPAAGSGRPSPAGADDTRVIAAFGDTGVGDNDVANVRLAESEGSQGYLGLGDYDYGAGADAWKRRMEPLLAGGCLCVIGNHDTLSAYAGLFPDQSDRWSAGIAGVRIIGLNTNRSLAAGSDQWNWLVAQLRDAPEAIKVVVMHEPWWLRAGARHPASEFPGDPDALDNLMAEKGVTLVLAGHEHNYQRSVRGGVTYVVAGTGGESLYPLRGLAAGTVASDARFGHLLLTLSPAEVSGTFVALSGARGDTFTLGTREPPAPGGGDEAFATMPAARSRRGAVALVAAAAGLGTLWLMLLRGPLRRDGRRTR